MDEVLYSKSIMDPKVVRMNHWNKMKKLSQSFYDAALKGDLDLMKNLMNIGAHFSKVGPNKMNPLHASSMNGHDHIVKFLIDTRININESTKDGKSALHIAVIHGHTTIVKLLLSSGAVRNSCDKMGMTPLLCAEKHNNTQLVNLLSLKENTQDDERNSLNAEQYLTEIQDSSILIETSQINGSYLCSGQEQSNKNLPFASSHEELPLLEGDLSLDLDGISLIQIEDKIHSKLKDVLPYIEEDLPFEIDDIPSIPTGPEKEEHAKKFTKESFSSYQEYIASYAEEDRIAEEKQNDILLHLDELEKEDISIEALDLDEEDTETLGDLLKIQATIMTKEDASLLLLRLMGQGRTIHLTEAGKRAFDIVKPDWIFKSKPKKREDDEDLEKSKTQEKPSSALVLHRNNKSPTSTGYMQELSQTLNSFSSNFKYNTSLASSPPLKRCRV